MPERDRPGVHRTEDAMLQLARVNAAKDLLAAHSIYKGAQAGMKPDEKKAMDIRVASGEEDFTVSNADLAGRRAALELARTLGVTVEEGIAMEKSLEVTAQNDPGINGILRLLAY